MAGEFAQVLEQTDDAARAYLHTAGTGLSLYRTTWPNPLFDLAAVDELPRASDEAGKRNNGAWVEGLKALSQYAGLARSNFMVRHGIEDHDKPDRGGKTDLLKSSIGTAQWRLVHDGWHLYDRFKPDSATGTEGGPFHRFVNAVYEYATGLDPEEKTSLADHVKRVCSVNREVKRLRERQNELEAELNYFLQRGQTPVAKRRFGSNGTKSPRK
jgi:hypothetical protein